MKKLDMATSILGVMVPSLVAANASPNITDSYFTSVHEVPSLDAIKIGDAEYFRQSTTDERKKSQIFDIKNQNRPSVVQEAAKTDTLAFLAEQGLLDSEGMNSTLVNGEVSIAKELAASCQVSFGCTTAYGSQASCEAGPGPGVWFPDTDDCTAAAPDPDINLKGNGQSITSGTTALSASNHTDFGSHQTGGSNFTRTFTIENVIAASTLTLSGSPLVSISASSDFSISSQPGSSSLNGVTSTTFVVQLDPTTVGSPNATVTITSNDPNEGTYTFKVGATVTAANTAPVVDLDSAAGGNNRSSAFSEGSGGVGITNSASVTDAESDTIKSITVSLTNDQDGASEGLNVTGAAQNALNGVSGKSDITLQDTISITGATATLAQVQTFLDAITYNNTSSTPNTTARTVTVVVNDGTDNSVTRTSTVSVTNVTSTTSSGASFNTTTGANLNPAILFTSENESLSIAQTSHATGSTADGGGGTDTLSVSDGVDISGLTSLTNFETLDAANNGNLTLTESQHESFTTINGVNTNQFTISSANGNGELTADADIETYVLNAAMTLTLGSASQNVTGSSANDVINAAALTATGTLNAGGGSGDTLRLSNGANIAGATVSNIEILELNSGASVTMTEAQHDSFSTFTAAGTDTITISAATDGLTGNSAIESYILSVANSITLGAAGQNITGSTNNDTVNIGTLTATGTLAGGTGTDTLSVGNSGSIAGATVSGFENLTLSSGASATISASQLSQFSGTVTAAGTETISVSGDGNMATVSGIENYVIGDDSSNTRTVTVAAADHSVTANSTSDAITFDIGTLTYTGTLTGDNTNADTLSMSNGANISGATISNVTNLSLVSGASVTMTASQHGNFSGSVTAGGSETVIISGDGNITTLSGIENYTIGDDSSNTRTVTVGATTTVNATSATDAVTFDIGGQSFTGSLTGEATVADILSASNGADTSGGSFTNVGTLSLASGATVTIDAQNISDFSTAINGAAGSETLNLVGGGTFNFGSTSVSSVENISLGSNSVTSLTITDNFSANGGSVTISNSSGSAINAGVTINASALAGDSLVISATDLTGNDTLTGGNSTDTLRPGAGTDSMTGNSGNDTFIGSASDLNGDTIADLAVGDVVTVTGVTGLTTNNVRFNGNSTLQVDTDATDFASVEVALTLSSSPGAGLDFTVSDSGANTVITFIAANDVPVFSSLNGLSTFTENGSAVAIDNDATVADTELDALNGGVGNYNGASLTISRNGGANAQDIFANLNLLGTLTQGSTFTYNGTNVGTVTTNSAGTLVLAFNASATSAIVDGVIQSISYVNNSESPPSSVTLNYTFNDGTANSSGTNQAVVTINAQNDAPTDIALSSTTINQSATAAATNVGSLSTTDVDGGDSHTYTLVTSGSSASGTCSANSGNSSFQISSSNLQTQAALSAGSYIVCIQTNDGTTTFQKSFTVTVSDDVAPNAPSTPDLTSGSDTGASSTDNNTSDTTPTFSGTAESGSTVRLYSDQSGSTVLGSATAIGGNWQITTSALAATTHAITAKATDASNNESSASNALSVTIDTTAPSAPSSPDLSSSSDSGNSNTDNITNDTTPTITGTGTTGDTINLSSNLDGNIGSTTVSGGTWSITSSTLQAGSHTVSAQSVDNAGNTTSAASSLSLIVDTQAPSGHSVSFGDTLYSNTEKGAASFTFSNAEVGATYSYTISSSNGGTNVTGNGTVTSAGQQLTNLDLSALNDGTLTLSVILTDTAGNAATAVTANSTLDTAAPSGHSVALNDTSYNSAETGGVNFSFTSAEVGATYSYTLSSDNGGTAVTGNGSVTSAGQTVNVSDISGLNDGNLTLSVTVSDTAGNAATAVTDTATLDKTKPTVTTFSASDSNLKVGETATISIVLSEASSTFASSDIIVSGGTLSNFSATSSTQYSVLFTPTANSEANATLDIAADTFTDAAGNNNTAATQLPITVDTKAPSGHSVSFGDTLYSNTEKGAASFTFSSAEVGATYSYTISSSNGGTNVTGNGTVTSAGQQLTNLDLSALNDGTLTLSVILTDTAGNAATAATANSTLDTAAPSG
ncbi:Ig-like domain-containing protein, partial [Pseudoalteromonas luteoviolacea]|uniref:Ig-like domain-containing protein n=1 Tax=Pseudoalteromonas luteoviolacea TaxID=43657 RepID=UPI00159F03D2